MAITRNPHGISSFGVPIMGGGGAIPVTNGNYYFVDSGAGNSGNNGTAPDDAMDSIVNAHKLCTDGNNDVIVVMQEHAETLSSATALAMNKAGVAVVGMGYGSQRPTITLDTANTTTIAVSAANVSFNNIIFIGNFLSIASCFTLTTAKSFTVTYCDFRDTSAIKGFLSIVTNTVSVNSDGLTFCFNKVYSDATTTPGPAITIAGTIDRLYINDNEIVHSTASNNIPAVLTHGALVVSHLEMYRNRVYSVNTDTATGGLLIKTSATTGSGMVVSNRVYALDVAAEILVTAAAVQYGLFDNLYTGDTGTSGFVSPAIGSTS